MDRNEKSTSDRGPSIDVACQISFHLVETKKDIQMWKANRRQTPKAHEGTM
jgi:hypothetical protein